MTEYNAILSQAQDARWGVGSALLALSLFYAISALVEHFRGAKVPLIGRRFWFEPLIVSNYRFFRDAKKIVDKGYIKFKETTFKFVRLDAEILVLPAHYVNELRNLPDTIANPTLAIAHNLIGRHTNIEPILHSNINIRALQEKLNPNLGSLTTLIQDELNYILDREMPTCEDDWVSFKPHHAVLRLVAGISARVFLGLPLCRNEQWFEISTKFTKNAFECILLLRMFPMWLHGFLSMVLPGGWRGASYIRQAKRLLVPEIKRRQQEFWCDKSSSSENSLLSWMIEIAKEHEKKPSKLAHMEVLISFASIFTTQMSVVHALYDLAARPGYTEPLREEIRQVIAEDGPWIQWKKTSFTKLRLLDSFMKESQRWNPPSLLGYNRIMVKDHTLSDGTILHAGSHICMAVSAIQNDEKNTPSPEIFDGFRYSKLRECEDEGHLHQFATTEAANLNFGHGKYACPGRFFAALEIKNILVRLIMDYDLKLADGAGRPENMSAHEFIFPNPEGHLLVKRHRMVDQLQP